MRHQARPEKRIDPDADGIAACRQPIEPQLAPALQAMAEHRAGTRASPEMGAGLALCPPAVNMQAHELFQERVDLGEGLSSRQSQTAPFLETPAAPVESPTGAPSPTVSRQSTDRSR